MINTEKSTDLYYFPPLAKVLIISGISVAALGALLYLLPVPTGNSQIYLIGGVSGGGFASMIVGLVVLFCKQKKQQPSSEPSISKTQVTKEIEEEWKENALLGEELSSHPPQSSWLCYMPKKKNDLF